MIRYFYALAALATTLAAPVLAQEIPGKQWKDGPLTWEDFRMRDAYIRGGSEMHYNVKYQPQKYKQQDTLIFRTIVTAYVDPAQSWVAVGQQTDQSLRLHQLTFDIIELYRRQMQQEVDRASTVFEIEAALRKLNQMSESRIERMRQETNLAQDLKQLSAWEQSISAELQTLPAEQQPVIRRRNFGYGMHAGIGASSFTGSLDAFVQPAYSFTYGFDFSYKKAAMYLKAMLGVTSLKSSYDEKYNWPANQKTGYADIEATVGYAILDNTRHKITPYAGLAITELSKFKQVKDQKGEALVDANIAIGLVHDYKIRRTVKLVPNPYGIREGADTNISSRLSLVRANYAPNLQGYIINFTVSASVAAYMLKNQQ